jgi:hypothetical protein
MSLLTVRQINFINLKIKLTQSFKNIYKNKMYFHMFIEMSDLCLKCISTQKKKSEKTEPAVKNGTKPTRAK